MRSACVCVHVPCAHKLRSGARVYDAHSWMWSLVVLLEVLRRSDCLALSFAWARGQTCYVNTNGRLSCHVQCGLLDDSPQYLVNGSSRFGYKVTTLFKILALPGHLYRWLAMVLPLDQFWSVWQACFKWVACSSFEARLVCMRCTVCHNSSSVCLYECLRDMTLYTRHTCQRIPGHKYVVS